eukprot:gene5686-7076_t
MYQMDIAMDENSFPETPKGAPLSQISNSTLNIQHQQQQQLQPQLSSFNNSQNYYSVKPIKKKSQFQENVGRIQEYTDSVTGNLKNQFHTLQDSYKSSQFASVASNIYKKNLEDKNKEIEKYKDKINELYNSIQHLTNENSGLQTRISGLNEMITNLQGKIELTTTDFTSLQSKINQLNNTINERDQKVSDIYQLCLQKEEIIKQKDQEIKDLLEKSQKDESIRKNLHNMIMELKGNIRVFARVRPCFDKDPNAHTLYQYPQNSDNSIDVNVPSTSFVGAQSVRRLSFSFDRVFGPSSTQAMVFEELSQLVQSALDGYNTCIFTYGQTGSGKTWTMEGSPNSIENRGMIQRTVEKIFDASETLKQKGWVYEMEASFLEIYNETIHDLLNPKASDSTKYDIKHEANNQTSVTNLSVFKVKSSQQVYELLSIAAKTRSVAKTLCNERSSRSHSVFQLKLLGNNSYSGQTTQGLLNLIDLAGSERLSKSGASGDRLKETQAINKSLSSLSDVISALANKEQHVPFRNSKLTYLLQNSLGGNSKTLMFVNISPDLKDVNESISSLRFATKVNSCEIGTARKQIKVDLSQSQA